MIRLFFMRMSVLWGSEAWFVLFCGLGGRGGGFVGEEAKMGKGR